MEKTSYLLTHLKNINEIFMKYVTYDKIKSKKKELYPLSRRYVFEKKSFFSFLRRFNVEYTWYVCREAFLRLSLFL